MASAGLEHIELTPGHAAQGFALSTLVGWNQSLADWTYMLEAGMGVGLVDHRGQLVACAMGLPYERFAWICMVLVAPDFRRRGLATGLMDEVAARQTAEGRVPGLDATPDGREVYRKIGFQEDYRLGRFRAERVATPAPAAETTAIRPLTPEHMTAVSAVDSDVFGADRRPLLRHLLGRVPAAAYGAWQGDALCGWVLARDGREASQIGPLIADDNATAIGLAAAALQAVEAPVYLDVPEAKISFTVWLESCGFALQRPYIRMYQGRKTGFDRPEKLFAIAGPELG